MSEPEPLTWWHVCNCNMSRRLAAREFRIDENAEVYERTRAVDDETESGVNYAARPVDKLRHETTEDLTQVILWLLEAGRYPVLWKRDLRKAFRGVPIAPEHLDLSWVVWSHDNVVYVAQHKRHAVRH